MKSSVLEIQSKKFNPTPNTFDLMSKDSWSFVKDRLENRETLENLKLERNSGFFSMSFDL